MATTAIKVFFLKKNISFDYLSQQVMLNPNKIETKKSQTIREVSCTNILRIFLLYSFHFEFDSKQSYTTSPFSIFFSEAVALFAFFQVIEISQLLVIGYSVIHRSNFESNLNNFPFSQATQKSFLVFCPLHHR